MGDIIKADFGGDKDKKEDENNPADNAANKLADVVEIKPVIRENESAGEAPKNEDGLTAFDIYNNSFGSMAKAEARNSSTLTEALAYISSIEGKSLSMFRSLPTYEDNLFVFKEIDSHGERENLFKLLEESSEEKWKADPVYYLALIDVLRGDFPD